MTEGETSTSVRSVFVSDVHLGFRYGNAVQLLDFLSLHQPQFLYLVGDILDGWRLKSKWYWPPSYSQIVDRIFDLSQNGTQVYYTPGNHDDFLRQAIPQMDSIQIADQFIHSAADGRSYCVVHGDLFDSIERQLKWLSTLGTRIYTGLMWLNFQANRGLRRMGLRERNVCYAVKRLSKKMVGALNRFENRLIEHARDQQCDGVICGHVHFPRLSITDGIIYCNTGDWVEHSSALIERNDGTLILLDQGETIDRLEATHVDQRRSQSQAVHPAIPSDLDVAATR